MNGQAIAPSTGPIQLRPFSVTDATALAGLLTHGQPLVGPVPVAALSIEEAEADYFAKPPNHLWVAEVDGLVVGFAGLKHDQPMVARLTMLCIDEDWSDAGVAESLLQAALRHCHHFGYLKLVAETAWPAAQIIDLFARCGLRYTRHRGDLDELTCLLEFYVDLYRHGGHAAIDSRVVPDDEAVTVR